MPTTNSAVDENDHSSIDLTPPSLIRVRRKFPGKGLTGADHVVRTGIPREEATKRWPRARQQLLPLADEEGFEVELQNGVLDLVFEEPRESKFVVSPNAPVRQIWVSAMSRSYKLAWDDERESVCAER